MVGSNPALEQVAELCFFGMNGHYLVTHHKPWYVQCFPPGRPQGDDKGLFTTQTPSYTETEGQKLLKRLEPDISCEW
jgi:hypothetical protein